VFSKFGNLGCYPFHENRVYTAVFLLFITVPFGYRGSPDLDNNLVYIVKKLFSICQE
jgi:hypothetical protein